AGDWHIEGGREYVCRTRVLYRENKLIAAGCSGPRRDKLVRVIRLGGRDDAASRRLNRYSCAYDRRIGPQVIEIDRQGAIASDCHQFEIIRCRFRARSAGYSERQCIGLAMVLAFVGGAIQAKKSERQSRKNKNWQRSESAHLRIPSRPRQTNWS